MYNRHEPLTCAIFRICLYDDNTLSKILLQLPSRTFISHFFRGRTKFQKFTPRSYRRALKSSRSASTLAFLLGWSVVGSMATSMGGVRDYYTSQ